MRSLAGTPLALLLVGAAGYGVCLAIGANPALREMLIAAGIVCVATAAAALPMFLARRADQTTAAQAGLVATTVHLFVAIAIAGVVILFAKPAMAFSYWLFAFYGATLILVALDAVRLVRSAPLANTAHKP